MAHLEVAGGRLYYEADGHISAPPVLLIHAGIATLRMWDEVVPTLAIDHFVARYDTRGFGQTQTDVASFQDWHDAAALIEHLGVGPSLVIGCSRGGGIALDLALTHPDLVRGVVTIGSAPSGMPDGESSVNEERYDAAWDQAVEAGDWAAALRIETDLWAIGPDRDASTVDPAFLRRAIELNQANLPQAARELTAERLDPPAYGRLDQLGIPVLATVGEYDLDQTKVEQAYLLEAIKQAEGHVFADTAHLPSVERPDAVLAVLTEWMQRHSL